MLKAVYRRGAGAFSSSHRPGMTRDGWAFARVNAFLRLLKSGRPANPNYKQDNDLLPAKHPRSSKGDASIIASLYANQELYTLNFRMKKSITHQSTQSSRWLNYLVKAMKLFLRYVQTWLRAIRDNESPFDRAAVLASALYGSKDADLLPVKEQE
jgi:hypothetical protein